MRKKLFVLLTAAMLSFLAVVAPSDVEAKESKKQSYPETTIAETEPNDNRNEANVIAPNQTITGIFSYEENDYFKFTFPEDGYVQFMYSREADNEAFYAKYYVYDENLNEINDYRAKDSVIYSRRYNFKAGTSLYYRLTLDHYGYTNWGYSVKAIFTPTKDWEVEYNDKRNYATELTGKLYGTMYTSEDTDYFKYTPKKDGYLYFSFLNEDSVVTDRGWDVKVYDKNLDEVSSYQYKTDRNTGAYIVKKDNPVYVSISNNSSYWDMVNCKYSIEPKFKAVTTETENNDSVRKSNTIKLKKTYYGTLQSKNDADFYKIKLSKAGKYKLSYAMEEFDENYPYVITVYDSNNKAIATKDVTGNASVSFSGKKNGTYYIAITQKSTWNYYTNRVYKIKLALSK